MTWCIDVETASASSQINRLEEHAIQYVHSESISEEAIRIELVAALHRVGAVGVKVSSSDNVIWADTGHGISPAEFTQDSILYLHPALWKVLGIDDEISQSDEDSL